MYFLNAVVMKSTITCSIKLHNTRFMGPARRMRHFAPSSRPSGARFRSNVNEVRFCDASHITQQWTCANYQTIRPRHDRRYRTIWLCICKSLFNGRPFLFMSSNLYLATTSHVMMSLCTYSSARQ